MGYIKLSFLITIFINMVHSFKEKTRYNQYGNVHKHPNKNICLDWLCKVI